MLREIPGPAGRLEALLDMPGAQRGVSEGGLMETGSTTGLRAAVVVGHPHPQYGGTMHTKVVYQSAKALARIGCAVLRFNFRGTGASAGSFDGGDGERDDFRAALDFMHDEHGDIPLWVAGMSFGAWVALAVGVADQRVSVLLGLSTPVGRYDLESVARSDKPKFFIHGERDEVCPLKEVRELYARAAEPKELVVIDAADHVFDGRVGEVADAIEDLLGDWS
jgi:alpha/beta superfamily hydrolase